MKKILVVLLAMVMMLSVAGCGSSSITEEYKTVADEQGIEAKELVEVVDELAELTAEGYGITKEEYIENTEDSGTTVLAEMKLYADIMGVTIEEMYNIKKVSYKFMTDEQKEVAQNAEDVLRDNSEALGVDDGETKVVDGNPEDKCVIGLVEEIREDDNEVFYEYTYSSDEDVDELVDYFKELLKGTDAYYALTYPEAGGTIGGTIGGKNVNIVIDVDADPLEVILTYFK